VGFLSLFGIVFDFVIPNKWGVTFMNKTQTDCMTVMKIAGFRPLSWQHDEPFILLQLPQHQVQHTEVKK